MDVIYFSFQSTDFLVVVQQNGHTNRISSPQHPTKYRFLGKAFPCHHLIHFFWKTRLSTTTPLDNKSICCVPWCEYLKILGMFTIWHVAITKCVDNFYYLLFYSTFVMKKKPVFSMFVCVFPGILHTRKHYKPKSQLKPHAHIPSLAKKCCCFMQKLAKCGMFPFALFRLCVFA